MNILLDSHAERNKAGHSTTLYCQVTCFHLFPELKTKLNKIKTTFYFSAQENFIPDIQIPLRSVKMSMKNYLETARYHIQLFNKFFQRKVSPQVIGQRLLIH